MKWKLICHLSLMTLCVGLSGCGTIPSYKQLGDGYVEATYTRLSWEPPATLFELRYDKGWRRIKIWPDIMEVYVNEDMAVFVANKAHEPPYPDEPLATDSRVFAVRAPELPLDITSEVERQWAQESGKGAEEALRVGLIARIEEKGDYLEFHFAVQSTENWPNRIVRLNWNQISDIMREVKEKGVVRKDRVWGTSYIEKEFKPEVQK